MLMATSILCIFLFCLLLLVNAKEFGAELDECKETRCKHHGPTIRFPFWLKDYHPEHCRYPGFELSCTEDKDTMLELPRAIEILNLTPSPSQFTDFSYLSNYTFFNCSSDKYPYEGRVIPCLSNHGYKIVALDSDDEAYSALIVGCPKMYDIISVPYSLISSNANDFQFNWFKPMCGSCEAEGKKCGMKGNTSETQCSPIKKQHTVLFALYRVYRYDKIEKENQARIEKFLEDYIALKPTRYSYADVKRITNQFNEKLGQGAYGTVFKGKLSNEIHVAVKILISSKGNGEEFINEVGTMGRIHHVNVVRLVGFCADGFRRALVYEFLPNDSLEKFISSVDSNRFLGWDKLQDIALGIAKGIEYLHQGCDQRILHFDIKPHNVLLDHNFNPKISDFGLAKLCSKDQSAVSMTQARGTMGYIAPEVFSRNFGNVSYKSDVYSFGIMLLEMVGGRKNVDVTVNTSEIYFPEWIYNLLEQKEDLRVFVEDNRDAKIAKKLAIVGLWCIQWHPVDRPSMKVVVQMLEGEGDKLTMPPNPFASIGPTRINVSMHARRLNQDLEVIPELE
uniref:Protein kinase domain-containing protein n=1 Tax=Fagus sylvatica TaxID=28930 RepID=A0A2N9FFL6_FAGSY